MKTLKRSILLMISLLLFSTMAFGANYMTTGDQTFYGNKTWEHNQIMKGNLTVEGALLGVNQYSNVFYADSGSGADSPGNYGTTYLAPFATIDFAIGQCTASNGDIIYVLPGHTETISAAAGIAADVAGISIIGLGNARNRPTITLSAAASDIDIDAANILLANMDIVMSGVSDGVTAGIDVNAADFTLSNVRITMSDSDGLNARAAIIPDASADRMTLDGVIIDSGVTTGLTAQLTLSGVTVVTAPPEDVWIINSVFEGYFATAPVYDSGVTPENTRSWKYENNILNNFNSGLEPFETPLVSTYPTDAGKNISSKEYRSGTSELFTVNGPVLVSSIVGVRTITEASAANAMNLFVDPTEPATDTPLCGTNDVNADAAGTIYTMSGVSGIPMRATTNGVSINKDWYLGATSGTTPYHIEDGIVIPSGTIEINAAGSNAGAIEWHIVWEPLKAGANIVAR